MIEKLPFKIPLSETKLAIDAAISASKVVLGIYNKDFSSSLKEDNELITDADLKSNHIIQKIISSSGYPILSEETKDQPEKRLGQKKIWIIDPLDGTADFVKKTNEFTIMIALVEEQYPILGVICCPPKGTLYVAQKGHGAYQSSNDKWSRLQVSAISKLTKSKAVGSRFHHSSVELQFLEKLQLAKNTQRGSSLKVIDISEGIADLYFTTSDKIKQWDTCASYCILTEAGGKMTDMFSNTLKYNTKKLNHEKGILATNGLIHDQVIEKYGNFLKQ